MLIMDRIIIFKQSLINDVDSNAAIVHIAPTVNVTIQRCYNKAHFLNFKNYQIFHLLLKLVEI
jgi:hypothetical protein